MSIKLKRVPLFGEGVFSKSAVVTRQRRMNCYLEIRKDQEKGKVVCYGTPGMRFAFNAATPLNVPMRGLVGNNTGMYVVAGNVVKSLSSAGAALQSGVIGSSSGLVGMALNPTQLMVVDGSAGYVFNPTTGAVTVVGGAFPNGAMSVAYCNGFFVCELPGTNQFFVSALNDGTTWNGLSFAAAVQAIDGIAAIDTLGGLLIVFTYGHIEFWQNVGASPEPFQYIQNSASMIGLEALGSRVHAGDDMYFLGHKSGGSFQNSAGSFHIYRIRGYQVSPVSTSDIDNIIQTMAASSIISDCTAFSYEADNHSFVQFNFPSGNRSLLLDATTELWSEVQSGITTGYAARHIGNLGCGAFNQTYVADYSNGNVYIPDPNTFTDNGNTILREVITRAAMEEYNTFRIGQIYLDMDTGVGLTSPSAQGYNPIVSLEVARDNRDFGMPRFFPLGKRGQHATRIITRRWGRARVANLRIRMTDPVKFVITSGALVTSQRSAQRAPAGAGRRAA